MVSLFITFVQVLNFTNGSSAQHKKIQYTEDGCQQELDGAVVKNTTDILTL